jgi:hypothetical protein
VNAVCGEDDNAERQVAECHEMAAHGTVSVKQGVDWYS